MIQSLHCCKLPNRRGGCAASPHPSAGCAALPLASDEAAGLRSMTRGTHARMEREATSTRGTEAIKPNAHVHKGMQMGVEGMQMGLPRRALTQYLNGACSANRSGGFPHDPPEGSPSLWSPVPPASGARFPQPQISKLKIPS